MERSCIKLWATTPNSSSWTYTSSCKFQPAPCCIWIAKPRLAWLWPKFLQLHGHASLTRLHDWKRRRSTCEGLTWKRKPSVGCSENYLRSFYRMKIFIHIRGCTVQEFLTVDRYVTLKWNHAPHQTAVEGPQALEWDKRRHSLCGLMVRRVGQVYNCLAVDEKDSPCKNCTQLLWWFYLTWQLASKVRTFRISAMRCGLKIWNHARAYHDRESQHEPWLYVWCTVSPAYL